MSSSPHPHSASTKEDNSSTWTNYSSSSSMPLSIDEGDTDLTSSSTPVYYDEATGTFYPTNGIRPMTPSYMRIASQEPVTLKTPQKLLVILDLNGTLFYRSKNNKSNVTARPHLTPFLDFLFANCRVMVWSSAQPHSVKTMLSFGFGDRISKLDRVWSREHFHLPPSDYSKKVLTIKDLEFVWDEIKNENRAAGDPEMYEFEFDQTNTVLIDDSAAKVQLQPHNGLALQDFDKDLASAGTDHELLKVRRYLEKLVYQQNVSAYIRLHPFDSNAPLDKDEAKEVKETKETEGDNAHGKELDDLARRLEKSTV
ncbi:hypothetical protein BG011_006030 [Mortierella polycephala]|uniref:Mitochondrial import inner membrane translocase subunit TIM50 n=1 Tax=Mortierella polycephala TaxID=41804 RepID=A0A9P6U050_9FUNG|nr:hypothetical protein BG011_006030 [Mortierella polycephala]